MSSPSDTPPSLPALAPFVIEGEIDMASAPGLEAALTTHIQASSGDVVLDCAAMTFIDSTGIGVLVRLARQLDAAGRRLVVTNLHENCQQVFVLTGVDEVIHLDE
jgi:anti-sigma B factor antagonist